MNFKARYKILNKASDLTRALSKAAINDGLDELKRDNITSEKREEMVNDLKRLLESRERTAEVDRKFEHSLGRLFGAQEARAIDAIVFVACTGMVHIIRHKMR